MIKEGILKRTKKDIDDELQKKMRYRVTEKSYFEFSATDLDGKKVSLGKLCKGAKATIVVNVASYSKFTRSNYK